MAAVDSGYKIAMDVGQEFVSVNALTPFNSVHRPARKALLVLGMSRSGTSLLAHVLHALGAALPRDLMGAAHGNPLGHFEPKALVALNNTILASVDRAWDDPRPIPDRWFRSGLAYQFMERITAEIQGGYGDAPLLVIKDPRLCLLLPLYLDALDVLDIEPLVILQMRPVSEVKQSLADRDEMPPVLAEFLWLRSVIEAEARSRTCRRVWVSMAELIADWPETVRRITEGLDLEWPMDGGAAFGAINSLLKPRQCHGVASRSREEVANGLVVSTWAAVEHGLAGDEAAARAAFDAVRGVLQDLDRMYEPYLASLAALRNSLSWRVTAPLRAMRGLLRRG